MGDAGGITCARHNSAWKCAASSIAVSSASYEASLKSVGQTILCMGNIGTGPMLLNVVFRRFPDNIGWPLRGTRLFRSAARAVGIAVLARFQPGERSPDPLV